MSEQLTNTDFSVPPEQDFDTVGYQGSMQQILKQNIGNYVTVDFLIGTDTLVAKQGVLYDVGSQFMVLYDDINLRYEVCDIFAVKFVTFLLPGYRPGQIPSSVVEQLFRDAQRSPETEDPARTPAAVPVMAPVTPRQAAYAHAVRGPYQSSAQRRSSSASSITSMPSV